jgi:hypothetical protein
MKLIVIVLAILFDIIHLLSYFDNLDEFGKFPFGEVPLPADVMISR